MTRIVVLVLMVLLTATAACQDMDKRTQAGVRAASDDFTTTRVIITHVRHADAGMISLIFGGTVVRRSMSYQSYGGYRGGNQGYGGRSYRGNQGYRGGRSWGGRRR